MAVNGKTVYLKISAHLYGGTSNWHVHMQMEVITLQNGCSLSKALLNQLNGGLL
jgi:hypothetical protein